MNAKHLALISTISAVLLANFFAWPQWKSLQAAGKRIETQSAAINKARDFEKLVVSLEASDQVLESPPVALSKFIESMLQAQDKYGLILSQMAPANARGAGMMLIDQALATDEITGEPVIEVAVKGTYASLTDFQRFMDQVLSAKQGVSLVGLKVADKNFEIKAAIHTIRD